jgi:hypothetical protein
MARLITVRPSVAGWEVDDGSAGVRQFPTGAAAEADARRMLERLSQDGVAAELRIYLRDGALAGCIIAPASVLEPA